MNQFKETQHCKTVIETVCGVIVIRFTTFIKLYRNEVLFEKKILKMLQWKRFLES